MLNNSRQLIVILGFGREGKAIYKFLRKSPRYKGAEILILDKNTATKMPKGTKSLLGPNYLEGLKNAELVFRSPGIPYELPEIQNALKNGVKFSSATKLFFNATSARDKGIVIGVTGTKGKGTTSTLLYEILKAAKRDVYLAGNIGVPAVEILPKLRNSSVTILELSSFQLHDLGASPHIAVILDIFPDHMDSHANFEEYVGAKSSISKFQKPEDLIFFAADNIHSSQMAMLSPGKQIPVSIEGFALFSPQDLKIAGEHNFKNAAMATTVARTLNVPNATILKVVKNFRGLPHRLELIRQICRAKKCIRFYNDSASTNPSTAVAAIKSFTDPVILIAGGKDKQVSFDPLTEAAHEAHNLKTIVLIGENKPKIKTALEQIANREFQIIDATDLKDAVKLARDEASKLGSLSTSKFINVILSPASASFDMFNDYADRGKKFKAMVKKL